MAHTKNTDRVEKILEAKDNVLDALFELSAEDYPLLTVAGRRKVKDKVKRLSELMQLRETCQETLDTLRRAGFHKE